MLSRPMYPIIPSVHDFFFLKSDVTKNACENVVLSYDDVSEYSIFVNI